MNPTRTRHQHGVVLPMLAIGMLAIVGIAGLAIDVSHGFLNKTRLQNALDAAALSGALTVMQTRDTAAATADARSAFSEHLKGEMGSLDEASLSVEFSNTLNPFGTAGDPFYARVRYTGFATAYTFASVLPGIGDDMQLGGSAVAGAIPVGKGNGATCDIAPVLMCGTPGDSDCSDGSCYGLPVNAEVEYALKQAVENGNGGGGNRNGGGENGNSDPCDGFSEVSCRTAADGDEVGPGNFHLIRLGGNGGAVVRDSLAGGYQGCLTSASSVETEPGNTVGPTSQGVNTRFNVYNGPVSRADYPPDVIVTERTAAADYWHDEYAQDVAGILTGNGNGISDGVPFRRVITVPIVECDGASNGQSTMPVLDFGCFFLTRSAGGTGQSNFIFGQFIDICQGSGGTDPTVGPVDQDDFGRWKVVLHQDPDSSDS